MSRYFHLDDLCAEDERVPLKWLSTARGVAYLDASLAGDDVAAGSVMELPLWLAEELKAKNLVDVQLPAAYTRKARADVKADANAARLREQSPFFYTVGLRLAPLLGSGDEAAALSADVHATLADRAAGILHRARTGVGADVSRYRGLLTDLEQQVFDAACAFTAAKLAWGGEEASILRPPAAALGGVVGGAGGGGSGGGVGGVGGGGGGSGGGAAVASAEASLLQSSTMPLSRGQKRQRSLLETTGV
jgi:GINS complex subunit 3